MKRFVSVLMTLCLLCTLANALAADQPFVSGVDYTQRYRDHGAVPSMLNFGSAPLLSTGESFFDVKTTLSALAVFIYSLSLINKFHRIGHIYQGLQDW